MFRGLRTSRFTWLTTGARLRSSASRGAAIAALAYPLINALGHTLRWRVEGLHHLAAIHASGRQPVMAFWHGRILTATFYFRRRGIVVITSENFDGEWIARIIERFGYGTARGSTLARRPQGRTSARARDARGKACGVHARWPARARARSRSPERSGWRGQPAIPCCRFTSRHRVTGPCGAGIGRKCPPFSTVALVVGEPMSVLADAEDGELERWRVELEVRLRRLKGKRWNF